MTEELTDDEWRAFQQIPDQGHSHRAWVNARIRERLDLANATIARVRKLADQKDARIAEINATPDSLTGRCSTMVGFALTDEIRAALANPEED